MRTDSIDSALKAAIEDIVRTEVGAFGMTGVTVTPGRDHDGDPSIFSAEDAIRGLAGSRRNDRRAFAVLLLFPVRR